MRPARRMAHNVFSWRSAHPLAWFVLSYAVKSRPEQKRLVLHYVFEKLMNNLHNRVSVFERWQ